MNLKEAPFYLGNSEIKWVNDTLASMSLEEKIGQLFCPIGFSTNPDYLKYELLSKHIGGMFFRSGMGEEMRNTFEYAQRNSKIPLLVSSNLEVGGYGAALDGTYFSNQLGVAATGDSKHARRLGEICAKEGKAIGINWSFSPVVDIDYNPYNPITNVRTFGSNPENVYRFAREYVDAVQKEGIAATLKHFPGDGVDDRDQHILTSVNSMTKDEWDSTFGQVYKKLIDDNALTVMAGHIALPAYETESEMLPASLSKSLLQDLLRKDLGFNGLIVTDATPMIGFTVAMPRWKSVPYSIEAGCDMFLFNKDLAEDYKYMIDGYNNGILSEKRLIEANTRILALKAKLGLHNKKASDELVPKASELSIFNCDKHKKWTQELADESITLVRDIESILPVKSESYKKVLLQVLGDSQSNERVIETCKHELINKGFEVVIYEKEDFEKGVDNVETFKSKYDLVVYFGNIENASNKTTNRINWYTFFGQGNNVPWFTKEVPTIFISLANPYHLLDVPMIGTYINAYNNSNVIIQNVVSKITGNSEFKGKNPVDPFCGRTDLGSK